MVRRVAFKKAILAGVAGAVAWEAGARLLILSGLPAFDLVHMLGVLVFGSRAAVWEWWPAGIVMHSLVGAIWAIFYAYFFWSMFDAPPFVQGLLFSILPGLLAGFVMIPQMDYMLDGEMRPVRTFASGLGTWGPVRVILGHFIYGIVMGTIYTRPVGYAVGRKVRSYV